MRASFDPSDLFDRGFAVVPGAASSIAKALPELGQRIDARIRATAERRGLDLFDETFKFKDLARRHALRLEVRLESDPEARMLARELADTLQPILDLVLGDDHRLSHFGMLLAYPGSPSQPRHRDGLPLFPSLKLPLPVYAVNVFVQPIGMSLEMGPTHFYAHSHRRAGTRVAEPVLTSPGDAIVANYETKHFGGSNSTDELRPLWFAVFARPWWRDHANYGDEPFFAS